MVLSRLFGTSVRLRIWQLAVLACFALVALSAGSYWTLQRTQETKDQANHIQDVRNALNAYAQDFVDAETGQRGYLLTHQESYLTILNNALAHHPDNFRRLNDLVQNRAVREKLNQAAGIFDQKLIELSQTIQLTKTGNRDAALAIVLEGRGQRYTDEFRQAIGEIEVIETALLKSRQAEAYEQYQRVFAIVVGGGIIALALIIVGVQKIASQIGNSLDELIKGISTISEGNLDRRIDLGAKDEFAAVGNAFNSMAKRLAESNLERDLVNDELCRHRDHLEELVAVATAEVTAIIRTAVNGIVTIDSNGMIRTFNPAAERLFGYTSQEVIGKNVSMLMESDTAAQHDGYLEQFARTGLSKMIGIGREVRALRKNGSVFPAQLEVGHAEVSKTNHFYVGFISDVTEQKKIQDSLRRAKEEAEAGARAKSTFIANMSHEIRTPMNAIIGFTGILLQDDQLSARSADHAQIVLRSAKALLGIINDILDISKLESGKVSLEAVAFHLPNALTDALQLVNQQAADRGVKIVLEYHGDLPLRCTGDPMRLRQILLNLVGNSIKFTENGSIVITVRPWTEAGHDNMLQFSVADTGIGMTPEQIDNVFEPFSQADSSTTRRFGGTGLGAVICKQLVEQMGGAIWVTSVFGQGSTFNFTACLPGASEMNDCLFEDGNSIAAGYIYPRTFHILLAEDSEINAALAMLRLKQQGHQVELCANGMEAVAAFKAEHFDLILMDVMMSVMDGLDATRKIRELEKSGNRRIPIIALTASVMRHEAEQCIEAGMDSVHAKPIEFSELFAAMEAIVPAGEGRFKAIHRIEIAPAFTENFSVETSRAAFDPEVVQELLNAASHALGQLNPNAVEPILVRLSNYLSESDLAGIKKAVDVFDFENGKVKLSELAAALGLQLN